MQAVTGRWPMNLLLVHAPGCPVLILGEQSGESQSSVHGGDGERLDTRGVGWGFRRMAGGFEDAGAASRFFPQFRTLDEALRWLEQLTGG